jgi:hypothetical protein
MSPALILSSSLALGTHSWRVPAVQLVVPQRAGGRPVNAPVPAVAPKRARPEPRTPPKGALGSSSTVCSLMWTMLGETLEGSIFAGSMTDSTTPVSSLRLARAVCRAGAVPRRPGAPPEPESGDQQERAGPDEYGLDGERGAQPEVIGEAAEQVGGGDAQHAAE